MVPAWTSKFKTKVKSEVRKELKSKLARVPLSVNTFDTIRRCLFISISSYDGMLV